MGRRLERLRAALIAGESSGLVGDFFMDELMAELDEARAEAERKKAWSEIRRIIDEPKWRDPPAMTPEEEERMIFEEVERLRHEDG